jgi:hypothetical protein
VARGWIAAVVSLFVAACSHALAGGSLPASAGLALCLAFSAVVCILLAGKTLSLARLSIAVALSQLLFHGLFSLLSAGAAPASVPGMHHGAGSTVLGHAASAAPTMTASADVRMWAGHALGAVITIAALGFGERAFWGLARLARLCISRLLDAVLPVVTPPIRRPNPTDLAALPRRRALVFSIHRHRGPPAFLIAQ